MIIQVLLLLLKGYFLFTVIFLFMSPTWLYRLCSCCCPF